MRNHAKSIKLAILDRDGVINHDSEAYIKNATEWIPIPGSLEAIVRLNHAGFRIVIATNQSGLGRGLFNIDEINNVHRKMCNELLYLGGYVDAIFFCPHKPEDICRCRKPSPGLLEDIGRRLGIDMTGIPVIGDSYRDIQAATAIGASPLLVLTGNGRKTLRDHKNILNRISIYNDLAEAVDALINR